MQTTKLVKLFTIIAFSLCLSNCDNKNNTLLSHDEFNTLSSRDEFDTEIIKMLEQYINSPFVTRDDKILTIIAIQIQELNTTLKSIDKKLGEK